VSEIQEAKNTTGLKNWIIDVICKYCALSFK